MGDSFLRLVDRLDSLVVAFISSLFKPNVDSAKVPGLLSRDPDISNMD